MQVITDSTCKTTHGRNCKCISYISREIRIEETMTHAWSWKQNISS
jgi:hypothetical protein